MSLCFLTPVPAAKRPSPRSTVWETQAPVCKAGATGGNLNQAGETPPSPSTQPPCRPPAKPSRRGILQAAVAASLSALLPASEARGMHVAATSTDYLFDAQSGSFIPPSALDGLFRRASRSRFDRCIVAAEVHDNERTHEVQLAVLKSAHRIKDGRKLTVGFEQFYRSHSPYLDAYVSGEIPLEQMLELTQWENTWGFDFELYKPIFEFCREHGLCMRGINIPAYVAAEVGRVGIEGLPKDIKDRLPSGMDMANTQHYEHFVRLIGNTHGMGDSKESIEKLKRYYQVQVLWEEWMSETVAYFLKSSPNARVVALMGSGHVEGRFGFPDRLQRRCAERPYTIVPRLVPWTSDDGYTMPKITRPDVGVADLVWYTRET